MKAYSYLRISSIEQTKGSGVSRQLELTERYCKERGLDLVDSLQDIGLSGFHKQNLSEDAALGSFLQAVNSGSVVTPCALVVESLDRISRAEVMDALSIFSTLIKAGVEVHTLSDRQVYSSDSISQNWTQLIISLSVMARGREESQIKSDRIKAAYKIKYQQGKTYGRSYPAWLDKTSEGFSLNPEKLSVLKRIISMYNSGLGLKRIAGVLNAEGVPPFGKATNRKRAKRQWYQCTLSKYLKSPALYGCHQPANSSELVRDCYPPVITEEEYRQLQVQAKANTKLAGSSHSKGTRSVFTGVGKCFHCGSSLHFNSYKTRAGSKQYIRCRTSLKEGGCNQLSVPYEVAEGYALLALSHLIQGVYRDSDKDSIADALSSKQLELSELQEHSQRLTDTLLVVPSGTVPAIQEKLTEVSEKLSQVESDITELQLLQSEQKAVEGESELQLAADFINGITDENRIEARSLLHRHCSRITVDRQEDFTRLILTAKQELYGSEKQAEAVWFPSVDDGLQGEVRLIERSV